MWNAIKRFFKWLLEIFKKLFGGGKEKKTVLKITVLIILLFSFIACSSHKELKVPVIIKNEVQAIQRTQLDYLTAEYDQKITVTAPVRLWHIAWFDGDSFYSEVVEYDSTLLPEQWPDTNLVVTTQDSINFHVKYRITEPFLYKTEYSFWVSAINNEGSAVSDTVKALFFLCDFNNDKNVDGLDLIELVKPENWGRTNAGYRDFVDINGDGNVDGLDLIELVKPENWGSSWLPN